MIKAIRESALVYGLSAFLTFAVVSELAPAAIGNLETVSGSFAAATKGN